MHSFRVQECFIAPVHGSYTYTHKLGLSSGLSKSQVQADLVCMCGQCLAHLCVEYNTKSSDNDISLNQQNNHRSECLKEKCEGPGPADKESALWYNNNNNNSSITLLSA